MKHDDGHSLKSRVMFHFLDGNPLLNSIWLEKSGGPFNLMHAGYGVGAAVAPALLAPFTYKTVSYNANALSEEAKLPTFIYLHTPYYVVAGLCCLCAGLFCSFKYCGPHGEVNSSLFSL